MSDIINGVPRELLERIACEVTPKTHQEMFDSAKDFAAAIKELRALLPAQPQASAAQSEPVEDRGWPDRDYWCKCCGCGEMFTGHKRQVICRICTEESAAQSAPAGEREAFEAWAASVGYHTERDMFQPEKYQSTLTFELWRVWQARAAWQCTQSAPVVPSVQISGHLDEVDAPVWDFINAEARKLGPITGSIDNYGLSRPNCAQPNGGVAVLWNGQKIHAIAVVVRDAMNRTQCVRVLATAPAQPAAQGVEPHQINCNAVSQYPAGKCNCGKGE